MPTESRRKLAADSWGALLRVHAALVPQLERELREHSTLPLGWYDVLLELVSAPDGSLTMTALSERALLSRTRISRVVDELAHAGLVERTPHPTDGRSSYASVTAAGRDRFARAAPVYVAALERELAGPLSTDELRTFRGMLLRVLDDIGH